MGSAIASGSADIVGSWWGRNPVWGMGAAGVGEHRGGGGCVVRFRPSGVGGNSQRCLLRSLAIADGGDEDRRDGQRRRPARYRGTTTASMSSVRVGEGAAEVGREGRQGEEDVGVEEGANIGGGGKEPPLARKQRWPHRWAWAHDAKG